MLQWISAIPLQIDAILQTKYFEPGCFITEGVHYHDDIGLPTKKCLKRSAIPSLLPLPIHKSGKPSTPPPRQAAQKRQ